MTDRHLRIGVAGLGGAGSKLLPALACLDGIKLAAAADIRGIACDSFEREFSLPAFSNVGDMCRSQLVDAVYIATPSHLHCTHTLEAIACGKHVVCEKPLATTLSDSDVMINAARESGVLLIQGHSKIFDAPVQAMHQILSSGRLGMAYQFDCWNFNNWMRRPRLEEELDTRLGGGVVFRQAPQLIDMARFLVGSVPLSVRALAGRHAQGIDTEGNFSALISFSENRVASLSFNGYGHFHANFDRSTPSRQISGSIPAGPVPSDEKYQKLTISRHPLDEKESRDNGLLVRVSCESGVMALSGSRLFIHTNSGIEEFTPPASHGRASALVELHDAINEKRPGFPDGVWARTTLEICLAILESSKTGQEIPIKTCK
jgi:phthalate 4,5-cis-dihydrodiol dehydrogenase